MTIDRFLTAVSLQIVIAGCAMIPITGAGAARPVGSLGD